MKDTLNIRIKNQETSLPRVLRVINRQGHSVQKLIMTMSRERTHMDLIIELDCLDVPEQLVKLLEKQVEVESADTASRLAALGV